MPVGGDVTQFSMGLMAFLGSSLRAGRLPIWNDLWGYGFPGIGESQIGAFYPPHVLLYRILSVEAAYTTSLVVHTAWCGLGAAWASRKFGASPAGSVLSGWSWATSGFFVIHLPHQWGYTTASWMPWIWGLGWTILRGGGGSNAPRWLMAALAIQLLPGHFQLAFITQVGLVVLSAVGWIARERDNDRNGIALVSVGSILLALVGALVLALMQLAPTYRLAALAESDRTFEYLGTFATTPLHLVSYLAPGLFHRSPLWRPLVWDPLHAIPEESLGYIGLVPLFLALAAMRRGFRTDPTIRALTLLAIVALLLSLGPYLPGFGALIRLPGFSFFRAPARWGIATDLALSLLAGRGLDQIGGWKRPARSLLSFAGAAVVGPILVVGLLELGLASGTGPGMPAITQGFDRLLGQLPWSQPVTLADLASAARRPQGDLRERAALARQGRGNVPPEGLSWERERFGIYQDELSETGLLVIGLGIAAFLASRTATRRVLTPFLVSLAVVDLLLLSAHRPIDLMPIHPLTRASPVLNRLASTPRGTRTLDELANLPMVADVAPVAAYRTLDLPRPRVMTNLAQGPLHARETAVALRAIGVGVRVLSPGETVDLEKSPAAQPDVGTLEIVDDPALASWRFGADWVRGEGKLWTHFALWFPNESPTRAWLLPQGIEPTDLVEERVALSFLSQATPLPLESSVPERSRLRLEAVADRWVLLTIQAAPDWVATWEGPDGIVPASVIPVLGGWMAVRTAGPGTWTLILSYQPPEVWWGLGVSGLGWLVWILTWAWPRRRARNRRSLL
jgi:hypothetical protein